MLETHSTYKHVFASDNMGAGAELLSRLKELFNKNGYYLDFITHPVQFIFRFRHYALFIAVIYVYMLVSMYLKRSKIKFIALEFIIFIALLFIHNIIFFRVDAIWYNMTLFPLNIVFIRTVIYVFAIYVLINYISNLKAIAYYVRNAITMFVYSLVVIFTFIAVYHYDAIGRNNNVGKFKISSINSFSDHVKKIGYFFTGKYTFADIYDKEFNNKAGLDIQRIVGENNKILLLGDDYAFSIIPPVNFRPFSYEIDLSRYGNYEAVMYGSEEDAIKTYKKCGFNYFLINLSGISSPVYFTPLFTLESILRNFKILGVYPQKYFLLTWKDGDDTQQPGLELFIEQYPMKKKLYSDLFMASSGYDISEINSITTVFLNDGLRGVCSIPKFIHKPVCRGYK